MNAQQQQQQERQERQEDEHPCSPLNLEDLFSPDTQAKLSEL